MLLLREPIRNSLTRERVMPNTAKILELPYARGIGNGGTRFTSQTDVRTGDRLGRSYEAHRKGAGDEDFAWLSRHEDLVAEYRDKLNRKPF